MDTKWCIIVLANIIWIMYITLHQFRTKAALTNKHMWSPKPVWYNLAATQVLNTKSHVSVTFIGLKQSRICKLSMIRPPAAWVNEVRPVTFRLEDATDILSSHDELVQRIHVSNNIHIHAQENEDGQECSASSSLSTFISQTRIFQYVINIHQTAKG